MEEKKKRKIFLACFRDRERKAFVHLPRAEKAWSERASRNRCRRIDWRPPSPTRTAPTCRSQLSNLPPFSLLHYSPVHILGFPPLTSEHKTFKSSKIQHKKQTKKKAQLFFLLLLIERQNPEKMVRERFVAERFINVLKSTKTEGRLEEEEKKKKK